MLGRHIRKQTVHDGADGTGDKTHQAPGFSDFHKTEPQCHYPDQADRQVDGTLCGFE